MHSSFMRATGSQISQNLDTLPQKKNIGMGGKYSEKVREHFPKKQETYPEKYLERVREGPGEASQGLPPPEPPPGRGPG